MRFDMMNTINGSTEFSPFQLRMGQSPHVIPPLIQSSEGVVDDICALEVIEHLRMDIMEAQDNMLRAKISQALSADVHLTNFLSKRVIGSCYQPCIDVRTTRQKMKNGFNLRFERLSRLTHGRRKCFILYAIVVVCTFKLPGGF